MLNEVSGGRPATDTSTQCYILDVVQSIEFTSGLGKASIAFSHPTSRRGGPSVSAVTIISSDAPCQLEQHEFCYNDNFAVMLKLSGIVLLYDHDHEGGFFTSSVTSAIQEMFKGVAERCTGMLRRKAFLHWR